jgi:hypothetical protein
MREMPLTTLPAHCVVVLLLGRLTTSTTGGPVVKVRPERSDTSERSSPRHSGEGVADCDREGELVMPTRVEGEAVCEGAARDDVGVAELEPEEDDTTDGVAVGDTGAAVVEGVRVKPSRRRRRG